MNIPCTLNVFMASSQYSGIRNSRLPSPHFLVVRTAKKLFLRLLRTFNLEASDAIYLAASSVTFAPYLHEFISPSLRLLLVFHYFFEDYRDKPMLIHIGWTRLCIKSSQDSCSHQIIRLNKERECF
uniref:Uncharacterized protein n=1 Tax=Steinernema glaseri TaxID=37863 RepID=A0A1I8A7L3_9BILA